VEKKLGRVLGYFFYNDFEVYYYTILLRKLIGLMVHKFPWTDLHENSMRQLIRTGLLKRPRYYWALLFPQTPILIYIYIYIYRSLFHIMDITNYIFTYFHFQNPLLNARQQWQIVFYCFKSQKKKKKEKQPNMLNYPC
jgi:hypothetical protein